MRRILTLILCPTLLLALGASGKEKPRLTFHGLGDDLRIGMTSKQVKKLGFKLNSSGPWDKIGDEYFVSCHYLENSPRYPDVSLMMSDDRVVRIDIGHKSDAGWQSYSGAKVGMPQHVVQDIYGNWLKVSGHPYLGNAGAYLRLDSSDGEFAMIFETSVADIESELSETDQEKFVTTFRSGLPGPVSYIEGCA